MTKDDIVLGSVILTQWIAAGLIILGMVLAA